MSKMRNAISTTRNMMKEYLGDEYSSNHLKNFCLYWMKGRETEPAYDKYEDSESFRKDFGPLSRFSTN